MTSSRRKLLYVVIQLILILLSSGGFLNADSKPPGIEDNPQSAPMSREHTVKGASPVHHYAAPFYTCKILNSYPHDPDAFTQGLIFDEGFLYESTGLKGKSTLRKVELDTGRVLKSFTLPTIHFAEGLTLWGGRLIQLTWKSRLGFVYDKESFRIEREFTFRTEGWGLTNDGTSLIMSDGSSTLYFLDPDTFIEMKTLSVSDRGSPVPFLNELEYVKGEIFANIWQKDLIARISPESGEVTGWIDLSELRNALGPVRSADVLNGIAFDAVKHGLFVTGKLWPKIFEIEILPAGVQ